MIDGGVQDRRCWEDRRSCDLGAPPGASERRRPGRPPSGRRTVTRHVKLTEADDAVLKELADSRGLSRSGFILAAVARVITLHKSAISGGSKIKTPSDQS